jgi:hypothetical protein
MMQDDSVMMQDVLLCAFRDGDDSVTSSLTLGRGGLVEL